LLPFSGGPLVRDIEIPVRAATDFQWAPDSQSITFRAPVEGDTQLFRVALTGGEPVQLSHFKGLDLYAYEWSPDGHALALSLGNSRRDAVLLTPKQ
jgi:Tol biopolymer transport system component